MCGDLCGDTARPRARQAGIRATGHSGTVCVCGLWMQLSLILTVLGQLRSLDKQDHQGKK